MQSVWADKDTSEPSSRFTLWRTAMSSACLAARPDLREGRRETFVASAHRPAHTCDPQTPLQRTTAPDCATSRQARRSSLSNYNQFGIHRHHRATYRQRDLVIAIGRMIQRAVRLYVFSRTPSLSAMRASAAICSRKRSLEFV